MLAERPWSGFYEVGPSIWVDAHTTQFTEPGWRYLDKASAYSPAGASYVGLRSAETDDYTAVIETLDSTATETLRFDVADNLSGDAVQVWSSNLDTAATDDDFIQQDAVSPQDGSFELTVEPGHVYTVSTTTGQAKGTAESSADPGEQLKVPYIEDFDDVSAGDLAPYFADVHGAFEAAPCVGGRDGSCYQQVVRQQPIAWHAVTMPPTTMVGDPRWWGDYEVGIDALLMDEGFVELLGRVDSQQHNASGYHLRVADSGEWSLFTENVQGRTATLESGQVDPLGTNSWHRLGLRFRGEEINVILDGETIATVEDAGHTTGQVGLRVSGWDRAQFDNLAVEPTASWPRMAPTLQHGGNRNQRAHRERCGSCIHGGRGD